MKQVKASAGESARLFKNPILEWLSHTHFAVPVIFYYCVAATAFIFATQVPVNLIHAVWLFPIGIILFTLVEYSIHRFVFHFNAKTERQLELQYHMHGVHHEYPRDKSRLVMPMAMSLVISTGFFFLFRSLTGNYGLLLFSGFSAGYSSYLLIHYAVHALKPPKNFLRFYWKHHSLHHYSSVNTAYSVSFPLWDYLFGTMPKR